MTQESSKKTRTYGVSIRVSNFFKSHPNEYVNVFDMMKELELSKQQVQLAINKLRDRVGMNIKVITRGQIYLYQPETTMASVTELPVVQRDGKKSDEWFLLEYVGTTQTGHKLVRDEEKKLYTLEEF